MEKLWLWLCLGGECVWINMWLSGTSSKDLDKLRINFSLCFHTQMPTIYHLPQLLLVFPGHIPLNGSSLSKCPLPYPVPS